MGAGKLSQRDKSVLEDCLPRHCEGEDTHWGNNFFPHSIGAHSGLMGQTVSLESTYPYDYSP